VDIVIVDAPENVGKPSLRIDIVEFGGVNERQHSQRCAPHRDRSPVALAATFPREASGLPAFTLGF
jgi:hypothetical protein